MSNINPRLVHSITKIAEASPRKYLYMQESTTGLILGSNGRWIPSIPHGRKFTLEQAIEFLSKKRPVRWNAI